MKPKFTLIASLLLAFSALFAQPANDDCANAITLTPSVSNLPVFTDGTTTAATQSLAPCSGTTANDVWYRFVATKTAHRVVAQQNGMSSPAIVQVFSGTCGDFTSLQCFSGFPSGGLVTGLTVGTTYLVRIYAGTDLAAGGFRVAITSRPVNDECADAMVLTPGTLGVAPDFNYVPASTIDATLSENACDGQAITDDDVWFKFTATSNAHRINIRGFFQNASMVEVFSGTCGSKTLLNNCGDFSNGSNPGFVNIGALTPGTEYFFRAFSVFATPGSASNFEVAVTTTEAPANDECTGAISLSVNEGGCQNPFSSTFAFATRSNVELCVTPSVPNHLYRDVWFKFVATAKAHNIRTTIPQFSRDLTIFSGECNTLVAVGCLNSSTLTDGISIGSLTVGQTYFVRVGTSSSTLGDFDICVSTPEVDVNDDCASAITITSSGNANCNRVFGNNANASQSGLSCAATNLLTTTYDQWYKFTADQTQYRLRLATGQNIRLSMEVLGGACGTLTPVTGGTCSAVTAPNPANQNDTIREIKITGLTLGETYFIRVAGNRTNAGAFNLCLKAVVPPVNDDCAGAKELPVGTSIENAPVATITNMLDVTQSMPGCAGTAEDDLWYTFEAPTANVGVFLTFVNVTNVLQVFTGPCDNLESVLCQVQPHVEFRNSFDLKNLTPGTRYRMRMYTEGNFAASWLTSGFTQQVSLFSIQDRPANDACDNAIVITPSANNQCTPASSTTINASNTRAACLSADAREVWFRFEASATSHFLQVWGELYSPRIELLQGNCNSLTSILCFNDNISSTATQNSPRITRRQINDLVIGNTYYIKVSSNDITYNKDGTFQICLTTPTVPVNNECNGAITIPVCTGPECAPSGLFSTHLATQSMLNCQNGGPTANDVWFKFSTDKEVMFVVDNLNRQLRQELFTGTCDNLTSMEGFCFSSTSRTIPKPAGLTEYYLRVFSSEPVANGSMEFTIKVFETADIKINNTLDTVCLKANLISNPSFEFASTCPTGFIGSASAGSSIGTLSGWTFPTTGTSDFFNSCQTSSRFSIHVPGNQCFGYQEPRSGGGYVGLFAYANNNYREYIQGQLASPLVPGKKYLVSFYVSHADYSNTAIDRLGVAFGTTLTAINNSGPLSLPTQIESTPGALLTERAGWVNVSGIFEASEAYQFLIIGNFRDNANSNKTAIADLSGGSTGGTFGGCGQPGEQAYYYIDDVFIGEIDETAGASCNTLPVTWLGFTAKKENANAQLEWRTTQETNCRLYEIERSTDGVNYQRMGAVTCRNSNGNQTYRYTDAAPGSGIFYYRIRQVDTDGRFEYSSVQKVNFTNANTITVYPNPTRNLLQITGLQSNSEINLHDAGGRRVLQIRSGQPIVQMQVGHLPEGIYQLSITQSNGDRRFHKIQIVK